MSEVVHTSLKTAVKGTTIVFAGTLASMVLWFVIKILVVRGVSVDEFGIYSLAFTIVSILSTFATLGTHEGTTRFISTYLGKDKRQDAESLTRASLQINIVSSVMASAFLFVLSDIVARHVFYKPEMAFPLRIISFSVPFSVMLGTVGNVLRGHSIVRAKVYYQDIGHPLFYLGALSFVILFGLPFINIIYAFVFATATALVAITSYGYKKLGGESFSLGKGNRHGELIRLSIPLMLVNITAMVLSWTDTLMLGRYAGVEDVGVYNVSISLAKLLPFFLGAFMFVFLPLAGELNAKGQQKELKRIYQILTKWIFAASLPLFFILFLFPEMTIMFLFGDRFLDAVVPLRILSCIFLFHVFTGAVGPLLIVFKKTTVIMKVTTFGAVLNVVINYILIKKLGYGTTGAAIATAVSLGIVKTINTIIVYRHSGIHPFTAKYIRPVIGAAGIGLLIYAIAKSLPLHLWMMPVYLILFVAGYIFSQFVTRSIEKEDVDIFEVVLERAGIRLRVLRKVLEKLRG